MSMVSLDKNDIDFKVYETKQKNNNNEILKYANEVYGYYKSKFLRDFIDQ